MVGIEFLVVFLLICLNGLLAGSELAMVSARPSRLEQRAAEGNAGAITALRLHAQPDRFLSTIQIGITLIGVGTGALGGATLADPVGNVLAYIPGIGEQAGDRIAVAVVVIGITYLSLVVGELVPKRIALQQADRVSIFMSRPLSIMSSATAPVVTVLAKSSDVVLRLLGAKPTDGPSVTAEEVQHLLREGTESGVFEHAERRMVEGIFDIGDRTAGELMTPRHRVVFLDVTDVPEENRRLMQASSHSHYPVCEGSTDNVIGIVSTRALWAQALRDESFDLRTAMNEAHFVPEIAPVLDVVDQMRRSRTRDSIVVDEYGGIAGLITLDDVLSDVVGELDDVTNTGIKGSTLRDDGSWLLDGGFPAHEARELLDIRELPGEEDGRFETMGGFVMDQLGHIPNAGEHVEVEGYRIEVVDMDGNRIDKLLVEKIRVGGERNGQVGESDDE